MAELLRIDSEKFGLVLSGGGARGAYQIGVWKAMHELGLDRRVKAVAGTSVGAINTALFLQGDVDRAVEAWLSVHPEQVLPLDPRAQLRRVLRRFGLGAHGWVQELARIGLFTRHGLNELIDKYIDLDRVSKSRIPAWVTCRRVPPAFGGRPPWLSPPCDDIEYLQLNYEPPERIRAFLLASSAIPLVFGAQLIDGVEYVDGGVGLPADHTPVTPVYEYGCETIIIVYTERRQKLDLSRFPGARFIEVLPSRSLGGVRGTFDFSPAGIRSRMQLGYDDARRVFGAAG